MNVLPRTAQHCIPPDRLDPRRTRRCPDFNSETPLYQQAGALVDALLAWKPTSATIPGRLEELCEAFAFGRPAPCRHLVIGTLDSASHARRSVAPQIF